jgi:hypothetical protein
MMSSLDARAPTYPAVMAQISRSHHTVPRFYLQQFADSRGFVNVVRLPGDVRYPQSINKVSVINDFYNVGTGPDRDAIEKLIADEIERPAAAVFRKVLDDQIWPLGVEDRTILATYLAVQHGRGANQRKSLTEMADVLSALTGGNDDLPESESARSEALKHTHIRGMLDIEERAPYFIGRVWTLVTFGGRGLLTCDTPIGLIRDKDTSSIRGVGIGNALAITIPLSRRTALMMTTHPLVKDAQKVAAGNYDGTLTASDHDAEQFNLSTVHNARHCIYHHPDDTDLVAAPLPAPRTTEVSTSHGGL